MALAPNFAEGHVSRGTILRELVRPVEALASYDRALALGLDTAELHNSRGVALRDLMRLEEAVASFDKAIGLKPDYAIAYLNKAYILLHKGELAARLGTAGVADSGNSNQVVPAAALGR